MKKNSKSKFEKEIKLKDNIKEDKEKNKKEDKIKQNKKVLLNLENKKIELPEIEDSESRISSGEFLETLVSDSSSPEFRSVSVSPSLNQTQLEAIDSPVRPNVNLAGPNQGTAINAPQYSSFRDNYAPVNQNTKNYDEGYPKTTLPSLNQMPPSPFKRPIYPEENTNEFLMDTKITNIQNPEFSGFAQNQYDSSIDRLKERKRRAQ
ncbi:MAG: hypothetical protein ACP5OG_03970 [Candidatus Nanoarchaeia archaeon]